MPCWQDGPIPKIFISSCCSSFSWLCSCSYLSSSTWFQLENYSVEQHLRCHVMEAVGLPANQKQPLIRKDQIYRPALISEKILSPRLSRLNSSWNSSWKYHRIRNEIREVGKYVFPRKHKWFCWHRRQKLSIRGFLRTTISKFRIFNLKIQKFHIPAMIIQKLWKTEFKIEIWNILRNLYRS